MTSHLTPHDLFRLDNTPPFRFAMLGTCIAQSFATAAASANIPADFYLYEASEHIQIPEVDWDKYDAVIIHIAFRKILDLASGWGRGDVSYILDDADLKSLTQQSSEILISQVSMLGLAIGNKLPLLFLSFLEPPQTTRGFFANNRKETIYRIARDLNDAFAEYLENSSSSYYLEVNDIANYIGTGNASDSYHNHFTHAGFIATQESDDFYRAVMQRATNALHILQGNDTIKIIITDLDNTLWKGVAAEEDDIVPHEHSEGWPIGYVEALLECKRRGILLAICSKNDETKTKENFKKIWGDKIHIDDFCIAKINWNPKTINIQLILEEVNLLPDNALFIDDSLLEIEEVRYAFPEIRTLSYPAERWRNILLHSPQTQTVKITAESRVRTELIKAKIERDDLAQSMNRNDWLKSLQLSLTLGVIQETSHPHFSRAFELVNKTNQFNTTGHRWEQKEIDDFFEKDGVILTAIAVDRFANHGLISLALIQNQEIMQFVLSCRVFGLGIETALLNFVMNKGGGEFRALMEDTGRNATCRDFYAKHGFCELECGNWSGRSTIISPDWINIEYV